MYRRIREGPSVLQAINLKSSDNPMFSAGRVMVALSLVFGCQLVHASACLLASQATEANSDVQTRSKAYEEACVRSLRTLNTAQVTYWGGDPLGRPRLIAPIAIACVAAAALWISSTTP